MEFRVLGSVRVRRDEVDVPLSGTLQRTLMAVLLARAGEPVPVGTLTEALWPGRHGGLQRLHVHVSRLRRTLGDVSRILFEHDTYRLPVRPGEVDAERFELLLAEAGKVADSDPERCAARTAEALALWQGPPFGDLDVPLLNVESARLTQRRLEAIELRYEAELRCGRHMAVAAELMDWVREYPLRERLCGLLMTALYRGGRQADALTAFRVTRRTLVDELGLEPGPELRAVEQQILAGEPVELDVAIAAPVVPAQLPPQTHLFVGREAELSDLDGAPASARVCVVAGSAGVGKTALSIRWAHRNRARFPDGQLYVDLRGFGPDQPVSPADALAGFLRELGVDGTAIPQDLSERAARFRTLLDGRRMLVVLDNARSVDQVRPLLPGSPTVFVLVTSRDRLIGLTAREGAGRISLGRLPTADAVALVGSSIGPRAQDEPDAVDALVARCVRLPLALRIAAELIDLRRGMRVADLVVELAGEQDRLDALEVDGDAQASVRAVFSWSYHCLAPDAARLFRLCSLHPGYELDVSALAALTGTGPAATRRAVDRLVRAHLVDQLPDGRVQLHDLLCAYSTELAHQTDSDADRAEALNRLYDYYLNAASSATAHTEPHELFPRPVPPPTTLSVPAFAEAGEARRWLGAERANLLRIAAYAVYHGHPHVTTLLSEMLYRYLDDGFLDDGLALHQNALIAASAQGDRLAEAHAANHLGSVHTRVGDLDAALDCGQRAYEAYVILEEHRFQAIQLTRISWVHYLKGHYPDALDGLGQVLASRHDADPGVHAEALRCLGTVLGRMGRFDEARQHLSAALELALTVGDLRRERNIRSNLGRLCDQLGQPEQALEHLERARALGREMGDRVLEAQLYELGGVYWTLGRRDEAFAATWRCLGMAREAGLAIAESRSLNELGRLHRLAGEPEVAVEHHHDALALSERTGERHTQADSNDGLGDAHAELGNHEPARDHWRRAAEIYRALDIPKASEVEEKLGRVSSLTSADAVSPHEPASRRSPQNR